MNALAQLFQESGVPGFATLAAALTALAFAVAGLRLAERRPEVARIWTALALLAVTIAFIFGVGGRAWSLMQAGRALEHVDPGLRETMRAAMHRRAQGSVTLSLYVSLPALALSLLGARKQWRTPAGRWPLTPLAAIAACLALLGATAIHRLPIPASAGPVQRATERTPAESP